MRLNETETRCIRLLDKWFQAGKIETDRDELAKELEIGQGECEMLTLTMSQCGVIIQFASGGIDIKPDVIQYARVIEAKLAERHESKDLLAEAKAWAKRSPWTAWPLIILSLLVFLATAANQVISLIEKIAVCLK